MTGFWVVLGAGEERSLCLLAGLKPAATTVGAEWCLRY